jgi:hypothetical protein
MGFYFFTLSTSKIYCYFLAEYQRYKTATWQLQSHQAAAAVRGLQRVSSLSLDDRLFSFLFILDSFCILQVAG